MQGQRSGAGFFTEQGSAPNDAGLDQQMFWNIGNLGQSQPYNFMAPSSDDITVQDYHGQPFSGWDFLDSFPLPGQSVGGLNDQKSVHGWSAPMNAFDGNVLLPESQQHGHSNALSAGNFTNRSLFVQNSGSSQLQQHPNNSGLVGEDDDDCQILETPPVFNKRRKSRNQPIPSSGPNPLGISNGSSSESRRVSRKRKALDGVVEQPCGSGSGSGSGTASSIQPSNSSLRHPIPNAPNPMGASSHSLNLLEKVNPSLGSSTRQVASRSSTLSTNSRSVETSRRNTRPRIAGTHQQGSQSSSMFNIESATGNTNLSSRQLSQNSLTIRPPTAVAAGSTNPGAQPVAVQPSISLHRNLQPAGNSRNSLTIRPPTAAAAASTNPGAQKVVVQPSISLHTNLQPAGNSRNSLTIRPPTAAAAASTNPGAQQVAVQPSISLHMNLQSAGNSRNSLTIRPPTAAAAASTNPGAQQFVVQPSISLHRNLQSAGNSSSGSRTRNTSSVPVSGERRGASVNPSNSRVVSRNISDHPLFAHEHPSRAIANGNVNNPGNMTLSSQNGAGANAHAHPAAPAWSPQQSPSQHISRLNESSRRTPLPAVDAGFIAHNSSQPSLHSVSSLSQGVPLSSGSRIRSRPSQRHQNGAVGGPVSAQALGASLEQLAQMRRLVQDAERLQFQAGMLARDPSFYVRMMEHDQHRDMRLDVDNMTYEELLALEDRMGNVKVGLSEESIVKQLKQKKHTRKNVDKTETEPCCICQEEYNVGEVVGILDCGHDFHTQCIKQWLMQKNICPICKTTGLTAK